MDAVSRRFGTANVCGLGDIVIRAIGESVQRHSRTTFGERAEHDDGKFWIVLPDLRQRFQTIHLRHLDIQSHDIGIELSNLRQRNASIRSGSHDLQVWIGTESLRQESPNHDGVVNDKNTNFRHKVPCAS